jgi:hypothetical protein
LICLTAFASQKLLWQLCACLYFWLVWKFTQTEICSIGREFWTCLQNVNLHLRCEAATCFTPNGWKETYVLFTLYQKPDEQKKQTDVLLSVNCPVLDNSLIAYCVFVSVPWEWNKTVKEIFQ